jgi:hypothetical protein
MSDKLQKVWRTVSETKYGFFVWDVLEVQGTENDFTPRMIATFEPTRDGEYILIQCFHFFSTKKAQEFLNDTTFSRFQELTIIENSTGK